MSEVIFETSQRLGDCLLKQGATVTVAESCTGGALASAMTDVAGSSKWFRVGFITYANRYKKQLL
ncbi:MAG TPA: nicotinamide-nucleotide amidase, partial [Porticoccaceae bacterium]|nr:nicotinamide-nucleotide amidase [Porticoccaceae bacterium]